MLSLCHHGRSSHHRCHELCLQIQATLNKLHWTLPVHNEVAESFCKQCLLSCKVHSTDLPILPFSQPSNCGGSWTCTTYIRLMRAAFNYMNLSTKNTGYFLEQVEDCYILLSSSLDNCGTLSIAPWGDVTIEPCKTIGCQSVANIKSCFMTLSPTVK